tara:strand:+ start:1099 stop:1815 length:717 start_codon:yes stop_codon:yes gene_type:complete
MGISRGKSIVTDGLILYLDAANKKSYPGSGTAINDLSSNDVDGVLTNGPTFDSGNGGSIVFDDVDDYINFGNTSTLNFEWNEPHSIEVWLKRSNSGGSYIVGKNESSGNYRGTEFTFSGANAVQYLLRNTNSTGNRLFSITSGTYNDGLWHQFVVTYDGSGNASGIGIYIDTVSDVSIVDSGDITGGTTSTANAVIGARNGAANYFGGNIASVKYYNKVLTSAEILQNYNALKDRFGL